MTEPSPFVALPEASEWLNDYGDSLYRYALARLGRSHDAEEVVQETLLAALKARGQFEGRSQPLTWLTGILKRKILDRLRAGARGEAEIEAEELDAWFDAGGHWRRPPKSWGDPAAFAERAEFWHVVRNCLAKLPPRMAEAFNLRTIEEQGADEVCRELAISSANLWVLLHRARLRLVRCLEINWFDSEH
ncbi:MAG TPA: sigma-70 family RNA polymerase sigma factor [Pirellulales bacterium]|jgi:RNA polymerase sigma-70 factor (TIGR02943 family)|nr:sigma-70 family RNA polymerase sigma factor [Pirellulales bacterium]